MSTPTNVSTSRVFADLDLDHIDMDKINANLFLSDPVKRHMGVIDDCVGIFDWPRNLGERCVMHLRFLAEEGRVNKDLIYTEDLTQHVADHYGALLHSLHSLLTKTVKVNDVPTVTFVGYTSADCHALTKSQFGVHHDKDTGRIKIRVDSLRHIEFYVSDVFPSKSDC